MPRRTQECTAETAEIDQAVGRLVEALRDFLVLLVRLSLPGGPR
jgi:hypothetical protein